MKSFIYLITLFLLLTCFNAPAQSTGQITEGKEFWLAIPHVKKEANEPYRGQYAMVMWISSQVETQATVFAPSIGFERKLRVFPNQITQLDMPDNLMHKRSEIVENFGIQIKSDDPISVTVYLSYKWTGEAFNVIPAEFLGKEYVTLNMYQDKTDEIKPAQILIIATGDNTSLKYTPAYDTKQVAKGTTKTVKLNAGETYLIEGKMDPEVTQDWISDLTGTIITASKPVAVLSGHTKGAFPRYTPTMLGRPANFMRNVLIEMMWPNYLLGKEYVTAPIKYNNRTTGKIADDKGDLIRFVAIEDSTELSVLREDGSDFKTVRINMKKGEWYNFTNWDRPAVFRSNKPMLAGQYGKSWWMRAVSPQADKDSDEIQNPPRNGQGMMIALVPRERWISYAAFRSPQAIDNFVYITFNYSKVKNIYFDGKSFLSQFGNSFGYIEGTDYAYLTEQVSAGDHFIWADSGATFAGYAYGNWDRQKDGFAYGYPIGMNYAVPCDDSLFVSDTMMCGDAIAQVTVLPEEEECAALLSVRFLSNRSYNYDFVVDDFITGVDKDVIYELILQNPLEEAHGEVVITTMSGKTIRRVYDYIPELIAADPDYIDFVSLSLNETKCLSTTLINSGTVPVHVETLFLKYNKSEFDIGISGLPVDLLPGETIDVEICATALVESVKPIIDTVIAELTCYDDPVVALQVLVGEPMVWIGDADFGQVPVGEFQKMEVIIRNEGSVPIVIYDLTYPDADKQYFPKYEGLNFPVSLPNNGDEKAFDVYFITYDVGLQHVTTATLDVNTDTVKITSVWTGEGFDPSSVGNGIGNKLEFSIISATPNPFTGNTNLKINSNGIDNVEIKITDNLGRVVFSMRTAIEQYGTSNVEINLKNKNLLSGTYYCTVSAGGQKETINLVIVE